MSYKWLIRDVVVQRLADSACILANLQNPDWRIFLKYVADGGIVQDPDPAPLPIDYSNSDNIDKTLKALLLCIAQVGGLTIQQAKALFKQKFDSIP